MTLTQMGEFTVNPPAAGGVQRRSIGLAALIAPHVPGAAVSAGVLRAPYQRVSDVEDDHGAASALVAGARAAFRSGARRVMALAYGVDTATAELIAGSDGGDASTGTLANAPLLGVSAVTVDGVPMETITYVGSHIDPATLSPDETEVIVNTHTGKIKTGTASGGAGAGILVTYTHPDLDDTFAQLDTRPFKTITVAGESINEQSLGLVRAVIDYAFESNKEVAFGLDSGVAVADVSGFITPIYDKRLRILAAHYTGDLSSAWAALLAARPTGATRKDQEAPAGVTYTDTYIRREFGDDYDPGVGTWHELGVNAVYRDPGGIYRTSSDRAAMAYLSPYRWISTYNVERLVVLECEDALMASRQSSDTAMPYNESGLKAIENLFRGTVNRLAADPNSGVDELVSVFILEKADMPDADVSARAVTGADITFRHRGQIHTVFVSLNSVL